MSIQEQRDKAFEEYWEEKTKATPNVLDYITDIASESFHAGAKAEREHGRDQTLDEVLTLLSQEPVIGDSGIRFVELASIGANIERLKETQ